MGLEDRVAIASTTRVEWVLADLAIMTAGAATTTIYPTMLDADVAFIVADSGSRVVFAENAAQVEGTTRPPRRAPDLARVVTFDGTSDETEGDADGWVITAERLAEQGSSVSPTSRRCSTSASRRSPPSTWPSSSTPRGRPGDPRASCSPTTLRSEGAGVDAVSLLNEDDLQFLWLPLSHVFGRSS